MNASTEHASKQSLTRRIRRRGFTLIEVLVVIVIIGILLGIGFAVGPAVMSQGERQVTQARLETLESLHQAYLTKTGQAQEKGTDVNGDPLYAVESVHDLIRKARRSEELTNAIAALGDGLDQMDYDGDGDDEFVVYDAWDNLIFFKPGDGGNNGNGFVGTPGLNEPDWADEVGGDKQRHTSDDWYGDLPDVGRPYFASPGPDGKFGDFNYSNASHNRRKWSEDNIYSYDLE